MINVSIWRKNIHKMVNNLEEIVMIYWRNEKKTEAKEYRKREREIHFNFSLPSINLTTKQATKVWVFDMWIH